MILYLLAALGGSVVSYVFSAVERALGGGVGRDLRPDGGDPGGGRRLRADVTNVVILIGINFAIGFVVPNIDWRAHLGGLITGAVVAAVFAYVPYRRRSPGQPVSAGSAAGNLVTRAWLQAAALAPLVLVMVIGVAVRKRFTHLSGGGLTEDADAGSLRRPGKPDGAARRLIHNGDKGCG